MTESAAYITAMGTFMPGPPINNDDVEKYLGAVHGKPSRLRKKILKSNGIVSRHFAMNEHQETTYQNSELAAHAVAQCLERSSIDKRGVQMLAVASTQGDLPLPGMASIVQAALKLPPCEIITTHGVCSSGMMALKSAVNSVRLGEHENAVVCASELASRLLKKRRYESVDGEVDLEAEFLRWMLSDGAAALTIQNRARGGANGLCLRIDWIDIRSFASDFDLCMSCGSSDQRAWTVESGESSSDRPVGTNQNAQRAEKISKNPRVSPMYAPAPAPSLAAVREDLFFPNALSWQDYETYADAERDGALLIRQNLRILEAIVRVGVEGFLRLIEAGKIAPKQVDHFVCHYSSHFFRGEIMKLFKILGCEIPEEKWFTNLYSKGNTGCAAMFVALEELLYSGKLKVGQTVFCVVPESGRFCTAYMKVTVVENER
jgi:3-oxoacyl-[acyl-carrier-protein] synthase-3